MADLMMDIKTRGGGTIEVEAWRTRSTNLWLTSAEDRKYWTIAFFKTGATFGKFQSVRDAQYVVGVLISLGLDHASNLVRGREWNRHQVIDEVKQWLIELGEENSL